MNNKPKLNELKNKYETDYPENGSIEEKIEFQNNFKKYLIKNNWTPSEYVLALINEICN